MADTKLSGLTELAAAPAVDDELYIRDVSEVASAESKRLTMTNLFNTPTIVSPTINGTIATTGLTLPAVTLGGILNANSQAITNVAGLSIVDNYTIYTTADTNGLRFRGGVLAGGSGAYILLSGKDHASNGQLVLHTPNATETADVVRLTISGGLATAVATWANTTQVGLVLGGALDVAGQYLTFLERAAPGAGAANEVRMYAIVDGGALTDMACVFQDGTVDIFSQEV